MADIKSVLSGLINIQNKSIDRLNYNTAGIYAISGMVNSLSGSIDDSLETISGEIINEVDEKINFADYTAFEVFASDTDITSNTLAKDVPDYFIPYIYKKQKSEMTTAELNTKVPVKSNKPIVASKTHAIEFATTLVSYDEEWDVSIDWGDGQVDDLRGIITIDSTNGPVFYRQLGPETSNMVMYRVKHTYTNAGIYKITIIGKKYWRLLNNISGYTNLVCRVFDEDLPIADNFINLSSFCANALRLFHVDNAYRCSSLRRPSFENFSKTFENCVHIQSMGWMSFTENVEIGVQKMFYNLRALKTIDYRLPSNFGSSANGIKNAFGWCDNLEMDITTLFPAARFTNTQIAVGELFYKCAKLSGTVPADKLWNDPNITWTETTNAFVGCSDNIRAQVPVSWGGTASDDIINKGIVTSVNGQTGDVTIEAGNSIDKSDYTAFEVYAHDTAYSDPEEIKEDWGGIWQSSTAIWDDGGDDGYNFVNLPASMTHEFAIDTSEISIEDSDIIIDWGDGTTTAMALSGYASTSVIDLPDGVHGGAEETYNIYRTYICNHTYTTAGAYIVKVYGHKYYRIYNPNNSPNNYLVRRVFEPDLPLASNITNLSRFCAYANHLIYVDCPGTMIWSNFNNVNSYVFPANLILDELFMEARNLNMIRGFQYRFKMVESAARIFKNCINLSNIDFTWPEYIHNGNAVEMYANCRNLRECNLNEFLPQTFLPGVYNLSGMFSGVTELYSPAISDLKNRNLLWFNTEVKWLNFNELGYCLVSFRQPGSSRLA